METMKMTKVVRLDDMDTNIVSAKYFKDDKEASIQNGSFVTVNNSGILEGREVYKAIDVSADSTLVYLVCTPEFDYNQSGYFNGNAIEYFENKAGKIIRLKQFAQGARFSIANPDEAYTKGDTYDIGTFKVVCDDVENVGRLTYYMMRVL